MALIPLQVVSMTGEQVALVTLVVGGMAAGSRLVFTTLRDSYEARVLAAASRARENKDDGDRRERELKESLNKALDAVSQQTQTTNALTSTMGQLAQEVQKSNQNFDALLRRFLDEKPVR